MKITGNFKSKHKRKGGIGAVRNQIALCNEKKLMTPKGKMSVDQKDANPHNIISHY